MGAARCEKIQDRHVVERHYLLKGAEAFLKAYNRRFDFGYTDGEEEYRQGALRCYDEILQNPHLPKNSFIRASVIRQLKTIDPHTDQTSTFESPLLRYEDLKRAAIVDIKEEHYQNALNKLTDISDDIIERKKEAYHPAVLEYAEITRLLLLLHLEMPPAALAPSNAALLERYRLNVEVCPSARAKESSLDPELFLMFRAFVQGIQLHHIEFLRDAFDDLAELEFLSPEQHNLLRLAFFRYKSLFEVEKAEKECKCFKFYDSSASSDDEEEEGAEGGAKGEDSSKVSKDEQKSETNDKNEEMFDSKFQALVNDLEELEKLQIQRSISGWQDPFSGPIETPNKENEQVLELSQIQDPDKYLQEVPESTTEQLEQLQLKDDTKDWIDPLSQASDTVDEAEGAVGGQC